MMNGAFQDFPYFQNIRRFSTQPTANVMEIFNINAQDRHIRFYGLMVHKDNTFRFPAIIKTFTNSFIIVEKNFV